ncbi:hypothetical protein H4S14_001970 [Agrobacterium vitis]|nr:hypothetical protein [Agrobacterium vitis]
MGSGLIPVASICVGIPALFIALGALKVYLFKTKQQRKENQMKTQMKNNVDQYKNHSNDVINPIMEMTVDVGTELVSGLSLLG